MGVQPRSGHRYDTILFDIMSARSLPFKE
jgi:hypothetical protein